MEIKLSKGENVILMYLECPRCHRPFNAKKRKKTNHHAIPLFLKPLTVIKVTLCLACHEELNQCYKAQEIISKKFVFNSKTFEEFNDTYHALRGQFFAKEIDRSQFGEGLWSNLVSYLESQNADT